jgi:haloacetate dehalogenase
LAKAALEAFYLLLDHVCGLLTAAMTMRGSPVFDTFKTTEVRTAQGSIFARIAGAGPPLLLLHGFPQTHVMWRGVAPLLTDRFTVVCADLRGYGRSGCPASTSDHAPYAKRAMAQELVEVMRELGWPRFSVVGHDRGGRVGYRMALDHPDRIERLAVLDVLPTGEVWERADARLAHGFWPWSLLAQPQPLPETLLLAAPEAVVDNALGGWGSPSSAFDTAARTAYIEALTDPAHVHAICEEYRAATTLDWEHDTADKRTGWRIKCPVLALWSARGPLNAWYAAEGGPLAIWRAWADEVTGEPVEGGHFFPEEMPETTANGLAGFFAAASTVRA